MENNLSYHLKSLKADCCNLSNVRVSFLMIAFYTNFLLINITGTLIKISLENKDYNLILNCAIVDYTINLIIYILYKLFKFFYYNIFKNYEVYI